MGCFPGSCSEQFSEDGAAACLQWPSRLDPLRWALCVDSPGTACKPETGHGPHPARGRWVSLQCQSQWGAQEGRENTSFPHSVVSYPLPLCKEAEASRTLGGEPGGFCRGRPDRPALSGLPAFLLEAGCSVIQEEGQSAHPRAYDVPAHRLQAPSFQLASLLPTKAWQSPLRAAGWPGAPSPRPSCLAAPSAYLRLFPPPYRLTWDQVSLPAHRPGLPPS